jgi:hypothetical protein
MEMMKCSAISRGTSFSRVRAGDIDVYSRRFFEVKEGNSGL